VAEWKNGKKIRKQNRGWLPDFVIGELQVNRMDMKMDQTIIMLNAIVKRLEERDSNEPLSNGHTQSAIT